MLGSIRPAACVLVGLALTGCASLPPERGYAQTHALVAARHGSAPAWAAPETPPALADDPIDVETAQQLAFVHNPRIREEYARVGLARADLDAARRLPNPRISLARLDSDGEGSRRSVGLSLGFTELLMLPARKRLAAGELERVQREVASALLQLASEVETAWYAAVSAQQVAAMRDLVAQAAEAGAELAQRYFDAGNIDRLQLALEQAEASKARIDAANASADALRARSELAAQLGLRSDAGWTLPVQLPAPSELALDTDALITLALKQRLDLAAGQQRVALLEDALGVTQRWRWLGGVEIGYERERESDGERLRGPSLSLGLPIFDQGQPELARARSELAQARAQLDAQALAVRNDVQLARDRLHTAQAIVERYRRVLLPLREAIVARTQEKVNYMLVGVFELIRARQQEYDAYQAYLEAVRDVGIARAELRRAVGGHLPDDETPDRPALGLDAILPAEPAQDHEHHEHHGDHR